MQVPPTNMLVMPDARHLSVMAEVRVLQAQHAERQSARAANKANE